MMQTSLLTIFKYFRNYLGIIFFCIFLVSLGIADWGSKNYPSLSFYFLPSRGWELLAGAILAQIGQFATPLSVRESFCPHLAVLFSTLSD